MSAADTPFHRLAALMDDAFPGDGTSDNRVLDAFLALETAQIFKAECEFNFERSIRMLIDAENRLEHAKVEQSKRAVHD